MRMRFHLQAFSASLKALLALRPLDKLRDSDLQPAAKSLFARKPFRSDRAEREAGPGHRRIRVYVSNQPPLCWVSRSEDLILSRCDVPSLTITADPNQSVALSGGDRSNWCLRYCASSGGKSDAQAREHLQRLSIARLGCTVSLKAPPLTDGLQQSTSLVVDAPADAPVVVHGSFSCVSIQDMAGPVRVTATHARATILDTTGQVDATAFVMDFAGSRGRVSLTAEAEINLQMRAVRFEGDLLAWAQGPVRVLVPTGFVTPFQAMVNRPQDFVCRAGLCPEVRRDKLNNGLYVFTYAGDGATSPGRIHFRSEKATVVIDSSDGTKLDPS
jgi:hypothetical protein